MTEAQATTTTPEVSGMGHSMKRKEDPRFIRGQGEYIEDVVLPNMVWMDIVRSPYAHATIKSIDASEALAMPGVLAVITGKDLEKAGLHWMPTLAGDKQMVLPVDTVMYQSQEVAAVIAETRYQAADAIQAVLVDYEPLPVVVDPFKALEPDAPVLRPDRGEDKQNNHIWHWESGDRAATDEALAAADRIVPIDVYIPRIHVASIETCGCIADYDPVNAHLDFHVTSQAPHVYRTVISLVSGVPESTIRVKTHDIGGGFGGKVPVYPGYVCAIVASLTLGRPVKWIEDRSENLQADSFARDYHVHAEMGLDNDGTIKGLRVKTLADHGYSDAAADPSKFPAGLFNVITGSYDMPTAFVEVDAAYTNKPPGGVAYRCSFRVTEAVHTVERLVDEAARQIGMDPAAFRMKNFIRKDQFPYHTPTGWEYDSGDYHTALQKALDTIGYDDLRKEQAEKRARGELMGIGISSFTEIVGAGPSHDVRHHRHQDVRLGGAPGAPHRLRDPPPRRPEPGPGPRDDLRADRGRGAGHPGVQGQGRGGRHRHGAVRPGHVRVAVHAGRRRGHRHRLAQDPREDATPRRAPARVLAQRPRVVQRQVERHRARRTASRPSRSSRSRPTPTSPRGWRRASRRSTTTTRPT